MTDKELLDLGFKDTSNTYDGVFFREFLIEKNLVKIQVNGLDSVEFAIDNNWIELPNCNTIDDLKQLIKLFL